MMKAFTYLGLCLERGGEKKQGKRGSGERVIPHSYAAYPHSDEGLHALGAVPGVVESREPGVAPPGEERGYLPSAMG